MSSDEALTWLGVAMAVLSASPFVVAAGPPSASAAPAPGPIEYAMGDQAFYEAPNPIPAGEHGDLVRWQAIETSFGQSYRIMYLSQTVAGAPTVVTGLVGRVRRPAPLRRVTRCSSTGTGRPGWPTCARHPSSSRTQPATLRTAPSSRRSATAPTKDGSSWRRTTRASAGRGHIRCSSASARGAACSTPGAPPARSPACTSPTRRRSPGSPRVVTPPCGQHNSPPSGRPSSQIIGTVVGAPASDPAALASWAAPQPDRSALSVGLVAGLAVAYPEAQANLPAVLTPAGIELVQAWDTHCFDEPVTVVEPRARSSQPIRPPSSRSPRCSSPTPPEPQRHRHRC